MDRRSFLRRASLAAGAAGTAGLVAATPVRADPEPGPDLRLAPFLHGVASGDPLPGAVILWTRVTPESGATTSIPVDWRLCRDPGLTDVVRDGAATATAGGDFIVKLDVDGLSPATTYYYGFRALGRASIVGRTRTAPVGTTSRVRFAVVSCSRTWSGYFNAYGRIADRADLDLVVHLGDYIYDEPNQNQRIREPDADDTVPESLAQFRARYAAYRLDPDLRRAHQQHPWAIVWDNHDIGNGFVFRGNNGDDRPSQRDYSLRWYARRDAAVRAFFEWTPTRDQGAVAADPARTGEPQRLRKVYRRLGYGDLVDLLLIETRLSGRDDSIGSAGVTIGTPGYDDPNRTLLGAAQRQWLHDELTASKGRAAWRVIANQVLLGQFNAGGTPDLPMFDVPLVRDGGNAFNPQAWDGYLAERNRLFGHLRSNGIKDNVVVTGDFHTSVACDLTEDPYNPVQYRPGIGGSVGVEFLPTSVTSGGFDEELAAMQPGSQNTTPALRAAFLAGNPHIRFLELESHGYGVLDITPARAVGEFWFVPIDRPSRVQALGAAYQSLRGKDVLELVQVAATTPAPNAPAPAPEGPLPDAVIPEIGIPVLLPGVAAVALGAAIAVRRRGAPPVG